ncbi:MAG: decarboxylating 6-phosphogluconate dehydrogenase [Thermodesulfobacteriota bacterium]
MKIGMIGLGKMGGNMTERLLRDKHEVVVYNLTQEPIDEAAKKGAIPAKSVADLVKKLPKPKIVWLMVPAGKPVDQNIRELKKYLKKGDIIIDGGNSEWQDSQKRAKSLKSSGIKYIDCGVSGGVWGLKEGYCLMYGGDKATCEKAESIFKTLAPKNGYLYCGPEGSGHYVKMVHNGIEYGMLQAYAEGFSVLNSSEFDLDLRAISSVWQYGSVVRSWILELAERVFKADPTLDDLDPYVWDSGEGRWTVEAALRQNVPAPIITASLLARIASRDTESFSMKTIAALRNQFGGHAVKKKADDK